MWPLSGVGPARLSDALGPVLGEREARNGQMVRAGPAQIGSVGRSPHTRQQILRNADTMPYAAVVEFASLKPSVSVFVMRC